MNNYLKYITEDGRFLFEKFLMEECKEENEASAEISQAYFTKTFNAGYNIGFEHGNNFEKSLATGKGICKTFDTYCFTRFATSKQLEEMYERFQKKLWSEHEDIMGNQMIDIGTAEQFLQDLLMELGCWEDKSDGETDN